jgi:hypothetical protein
MKNLNLLLVVILFSGCAANHWENLSKPAEEVGADRSECESMANQAAWAEYPQKRMPSQTVSVYQMPDSPIDPYLSQREAFRKKEFTQCMNERGWFNK